MKHFTQRIKTMAMTALMAATAGPSLADGTVTLLQNFINVEGMSDSGMFVTGHNGESAWLYNAMRGEITTLFDGHEYGLEIKDVSNNGVVVGSITQASGTYALVWQDGVADTTTFCDVVPATEYAIRAINCISGDGSIMVGFVSSGWDAVAYMRRNGETIRLETPATDADGAEIVQAVPLSISRDNRYILARLSNDRRHFRIGLWDLDNLGPARIITLTDSVLTADSTAYYNPSVQPVTLTPNGKIIANNDADSTMYAYDIATGTTTIINSPSAEFAINAFGDNYVTATPMYSLFRTAYVVTPEGEMPMQDYFLQTYNVDMLGAGMTDTGTLTCVSANERSFAGMAYNVTYLPTEQYDAYEFFGYHIQVTNPSTKIDLNQVVSERPEVSARGGNITINGMAEGATVSIVDLAGRQIATPSASGNATINVGKGTYIVNVKQGNNRYIYKVAAE